MVETATRYQAHPAPGSVAELEEAFAWLQAVQEFTPDYVASEHRFLDVALRALYRELLAHAAAARRAIEDDELAAATRARLGIRPQRLINGHYRLVDRCEDPICPKAHDEAGRHVGKTLIDTATAAVE